MKAIMKRRLDRLEQRHDGGGSRTLVLAKAAGEKSEQALAATPGELAQAGVELDARDDIVFLARFGSCPERRLLADSRIER